MTTERSSQKMAPPIPSGSTPPAKPVSGGSSRSAPASVDGVTVVSSRQPVPAAGLGRLVTDLGGLSEGEMLGQFRLEKFVGGGGMGIVFRALDTTLNREVAVKVLSPDQSADEETLRRFRNEAQSAARLNHENIARVHFVGADRGVHYIVFEFIDGVNLRDLVEQRGPLPLQEAISFTYQIAQALEHASQRDVIHRDIKPSNVLVTPDGKAKLVDMGLARLNLIAPANELTASGVTLGTFDYISPEQARDPRMADVRSDLYSLGCSFFYMLTGRPPFPEGTVLQKLLQHQADIPPDPRTLRPDLPPEVAQIVARLLAKNPVQRYQLPGELIDELAALGNQLGMQLSASRILLAVRPARGPSARWRQHLPWAAPLAALVLIVLALDTYWTNQRGDMATLPPPKKASLAPRTAPRVARPVPPEDAQTIPTEESSEAPLELPAPETPTTTEPETSETGAATPNRPAGPLALPPWMSEEMFDKWGGLFNLERWQAKAKAEAARRKTAQPADESAKPETNDAKSDVKVAAEASPPPQTNVPPVTSRLLVVGDDAAPRAFASLHAACSEARSGDVIELRYDGRRTERPIALSNIKLTIRGGEGFEPVVLFRPEPVDPALYPPGMITVAGGQLMVKDVHWELELPRNVPADWSMFESRRSDLLQFLGCTFTIRNASLGQTAYHSGVAFFDIKAPPGAGTMAMDPGAADDQVVAIELQHCVARGEATFVRNNDLQAARVHWDDGLLVTSDRLLSAAGGPNQPRQVGRVQISLRHVTAMIHDGLALLTNSEDAPYQLLTEIRAEDCIFVSRHTPPLVEQRGSDHVEEYQSRLQWSGDRDIFDGFDIFWLMDSRAKQAESKQTFDQWQDFWRGHSRAQFVVSKGAIWKALPRADRPFHTHLVSDYLLDHNASQNPAIGVSGDGLDAGFIADKLPALPESAESSTSREKSKDDTTRASESDDSEP